MIDKRIIIRLFLYKIILMMRDSILYICEQEESFILKALSSQYLVSVHHIGQDEEWENKAWKLVILQDASWWIPQLDSLKKHPCLFVTTRSDIEGHIAPFPNLYGIINLGNANLNLWDIPEEMQLYLHQPVIQTGHYYFFEQNPETVHIAYCPTGNSVYENDWKLIAFLETTNAELTIISNQYQGVAASFPPSVKIVPRKHLTKIFKKAHAVIASGIDALLALALEKPCIVLGDYGLGGMITTANYEQLRSIRFTGRKGGVYGEMVPSDLLEVEITKAFQFDSKANAEKLRKMVWDTYNIKKFNAQIIQEADRIINLSAKIKNRTGRYELKPFLSSTWQIKEIEGKCYIMYGKDYFCEMDEEFSFLLQQCDGMTTIRELIIQGSYNKEEAKILWDNLYELWKVKLILFNL